MPKLFSHVTRTQNIKRLVEKNLKMFKLIYIFVPVIISSLINEALQEPQRLHKSDLFLSQGSISGLPEEDLTDELHSPGFQPELNQAVMMGGDHLPSNIKVPGRDEYESRHSAMHQDSKSMHHAHEMNEEQINQMEEKPKVHKPLIDPLRHIIMDATADEEDTKTQPPMPIDQSLLTGGDEAFSKKIIECKDTLSQCSQTNIFNVKCYLHCVLGPHPIGRAVVGTISAVIKSLCDPIGTIFDTGVPLFDKNADQIMSSKQYMALFKVGGEAFKRFARFSINAVPSLLMKYSINGETVLLKKTINGIETAAKNAGNGVNQGVNELTNSACPFIHSVDSVQSLVNLFYKAPKTFDVILLGSWMVKKTFRLTTRPDIHFLMEAFAGGLNILAGLHSGCGMLYKAEVGGETDCKADELIQWDDEKYVPAERGKQLICGAMPFFPQHLYDEVYPSIFPEEKNPTTSSTTAAPAAPSSDGDETHAVDGNGHGHPNLALVDSILKANIDYDDE